MAGTDKIVVKGDDAIALWKQGKEKWNEWVEKNPEADVDFSRVDFTPLRDTNNIISFLGYRFPKGKVDFSHTIFGDGVANFSGTEFGEGSVYFTQAKFGLGNVYFTQASFGKGNVLFLNTVFLGNVFFHD